MDLDEIRKRVAELTHPSSGVSLEYNFLSLADTKKLLDLLDKHELRTMLPVDVQPPTCEVHLYKAAVLSWQEGIDWVTRVDVGEEDALRYSRYPRLRQWRIALALEEYARRLAALAL